MIFIQKQRLTRLILSLCLACLVLSSSRQLLAQEVQGNVEAIASEPYGVARLFIPAGQLKTGRVLDFEQRPDGERKLCSLYMSLMNRMGVIVEKFGDADFPLMDL